MVRKDNRKKNAGKNEEIYYMRTHTHTPRFIYMQKLVLGSEIFQIEIVFIQQRNVAIKA